MPFGTDQKLAILNRQLLNAIGSDVGGNIATQRLIQATKIFLADRVKRRGV